MMPLVYPNMYIVPLENFFEKNTIMYSPDILSLVNEKLLWANSNAVSTIFKLEEFKILSDVYLLLNDSGEWSNDNETLLKELAKNPETEEPFSILQPNNMMDIAIASSVFEEDYAKELKESKKFIKENYIIESKVVVFPTEIFGPSENRNSKISKTDYLALKFWVLNSVTTITNESEALSSSEKKFMKISESPIIVMLSLTKLNLHNTQYQISSNISGQWNPLNKELKRNYLTKNYQKEDRLYLAVTNLREDKEKLDMSVVRTALVNTIVDNKKGLMNIDLVTYALNKF